MLVFEKHPNYSGRSMADIINRAILLKSENFQSDPGPRFNDYNKNTDFCKFDTIRMKTKRYPDCYVADANMELMPCGVLTALLGITCGSVLVPKYIYNDPILKVKIDSAIKDPCRFAYNPKHGHKINTFRLGLDSKSQKFHQIKSPPFDETDQGKGMLTQLGGPWSSFNCNNWDYSKNAYTKNRHWYNPNITNLKIIKTRSEIHKTNELNVIQSIWFFLY